MQTQIRKVVASIAVACALVLSGVTLASAADKPVFDSTKDGSSSITIHKRKLPARTTPATPNAGGKEVQNPAGEGFDGVVFKIRRYKKADLKTFAGWKKAVKLTAHSVLEEAKTDANGTLDSETTKTTANGGIATFSNLRFGVYLVEEVSAPTSNVSKVAPFLVFVPTSSTGTVGTANSTWNYDIHAYPKNTIFNVTKTVDTPEHSTGRELTYTIVGDIPAHTDKEIISYYGVSDTLDRQVDLKDAGVKVEIIEINNATSAETLTKDTHYKLFKTTDNSTPVKTTVRIALTKEGLKKLLGKTTTHQVRFTLPVTVKPEAIGDITNGGQDTPASVSFNVIPKQPSDNNPDDPKYPDDPTTPPPSIPEVPVNPNPDNPDEPSTPTVTKFAGLKIKKVASEDDPSTPGVDESTDGLPNAKFELWTCSHPANLATTGLVGQPSDELVPVKKVDVTAQKTLTAAKTMILSKAGVIEKPATNVPEGTEVNVAKSQALFTGINVSTDLPENNTFCLVEVESPEGYELLPTPVYVGALTESSIKDITANAVPNIKSSLFNLPNTGGAGVIIFALIGGGLVFLGFVVARRRKEQEAEATI